MDLIQIPLICLALWLIAGIIAGLIFGPILEDISKYYPPIDGGDKE